ncbi:hypothetical protein [Roseibium sp. M-1]
MPRSAGITHHLIGGIGNRCIQTFPCRSGGKAHLQFVAILFQWRGQVLGRRLQQGGFFGK